MSHKVKFVKDNCMFLRGLDGQDQFLYYIDTKFRALHKVIRIYSNFKTKM